MNNNWVIPDKVKEWATEMLRDPQALIDGTIQTLMANPHEPRELEFSGVKLRYVFDRDSLLQAKNPLAIRLLFVDYGPRLSAMFCSKSLRFQFGMLDKTPPSFADDWEYFTGEYMEDTKYGRGERVLTPTAKAIEEYVQEDLEIKAYYLYTSPHYHILVKGEKAYEGDDIEEFCETLYKELIK